MSFIIAGIHTGTGKTVCSAVLCQKLGYDYWKPIQAGDLENSDSIFVSKNSNNHNIKIHPEKYKLTTPASPHYAAEIDKVEIQISDFVLPETKNNIIVETAGGLMSPVNNELVMLDLIKHLNLPVILVSMNYLGSINHTLMSLEVLKQRNINMKGIVFIGDSTPSTEEYITKYAHVKKLFSIPKFEEISAEVISNFTENLSLSL